MSTPQRRASSGLFGVAMLMFLFPFATFSCMGREVGTLSGVGMAAGTTVQGPEIFGQATSREIPANPSASIALTAAIVGFGLSFGRAALTAVGAAASGVLGSLALLALRAQTMDGVRAQGEGMLAVSFGAAYWIAVLALVAGAAASAMVMIADPPSLLRAAQPPQPPQQAPPAMHGAGVRPG